MNTYCGSCYNDPMGVQRVSSVVNAVRNSHQECLAALIAAGADVNVEAPCERAMLDVNSFASQHSGNCCEESTPALQTRTSSYICTALILAAQKGDRKAVELLLEAGADVNSTIRFAGVKTKFRPPPLCGASALVFASGHAHDKCVEVLIDAGADVNITSSDGYNSLIVSAISGNVNTVRLLLKANVYINKRTRSGYNALNHCTLLERKRPLFMLLFAAGETTKSHTWIKTACGRKDTITHTSVQVQEKYVLKMLVQRCNTKAFN